MNQDKLEVDETIKQKIADRKLKFEQELADVVSWVPLNVEKTISELRVDYDNDMEKLRQPETRF